MLILKIEFHILLLIILVCAHMAKSNLFTAQKYIRICQHQH